MSVLTPDASRRPRALRPVAGDVRGIEIIEAVRAASRTGIRVFDFPCAAFAIQAIITESQSAMAQVAIARCPVEHVLELVVRQSHIADLHLIEPAHLSALPITIPAECRFTNATIFVKIVNHQDQEIGTMIGNRLQLARQAAGLSLRALADRLDNVVTAQAILKYEKNRAMPGSQVLLALSKVLNVTPDYLLSERDIALQGIEFRKAASAGSKQEKAVQARVLEQLERYLAVEESLALEPAHWQASLHKLPPIEELDEAQAAAQKLRKRWNLGDDPIPSMTELLEERGIKVIALPLDKSIFGSKANAKLGGDREVAAILVNQEHTGERQRFTLAHELGHLLLTLSRHLSRRDAEKAMDRFAGAFLVPENALRMATGEHRTDISLGELVELKKRFLVSLQVLVVRLKQARVLSEADARRHWQLLEDRGFLKEPWPEPEPVEVEKSHRLHRLAMRAVTEGALSESRAAELLGISVRALDCWLDEGAHADAS